MKLAYRKQDLLVALLVPALFAPGGAATAQSGAPAAKRSADAPQTVAALEIRRQILPCWLPYPNLDRDLRSKGPVTVEMIIVLGDDLTVRSAEPVDTATAQTDRVIGGTADSIARALRNPTCTPFKLPAGAYMPGTPITVEFDTADAGVRRP